MKSLKLQIKINIKKLSPVLNFSGAALMASTALLVAKGHSSTPNHSLNTSIQRTSSQNKNKDIKVPEVVLDGKSSLGQMWSQHLLNADNHGLWKDRETAFRQITEGDPEFAQSSIFRNARKQANKVNSRGEVLLRACRKAYRIRKRSVESDKILQDVWKYCRINKG